MFTIDLFRQCDLGINLSEESAEKVFSILSTDVREVRLRAGEIITLPGSMPLHLIIMEEGLAKSVNYSDTGDEIFFFYFKAMETIQAMSCITNSPASSYTVAYTDCKLVYIPRAKYLKAMRECPDFMWQVLSNICNRSERMIELSIASRMKKAGDRLRYYLYFQYMSGGKHIIRVPFTIETLARYLNLTRSVLSKELHSLEDQGMISLQKNLIIIKDPDSLVESV